jgi:hypothetical protein
MQQKGAGLMHEHDRAPARQLPESVSAWVPREVAAVLRDRGLAYLDRTTLYVDREAAVVLDEHLPSAARIAPHGRHSD